MSFRRVLQEKKPDSFLSLILYPPPLCLTWEVRSQVIFTLPLPWLCPICPTRGTQLGAPNISDVSEQVGEEATEAGCCGNRRTDGEVLLGVWYTADGSLFERCHPGRQWN